MNERCGNCKFWREQDGGGKGDCRRRAPSPGNNVTTLWPDVKLNEWCGEWQARCPGHQIPFSIDDLTGKWPGDESEEELLEGLTELDGEVAREIVPLSFTEPVPFQGETIESFAPETGWFRIRGVKTFNDAGEVKILRISTSGSNKNLIPGPIDAASYGCSNSRDYWEADWGFISKEKPLLVTVAAFGCPAYSPDLGLVLYGEVHDEDRSAPKPGPRPAEKLKLIGMCDMGIGEDPYKMRFWPDVDGYYPDFGAPGPCKVRFAFKKPGEDLEWSEDFNLFTLDRLELRDDGVYKNAEKILELPVKEPEDA